MRIVGLIALRVLIVTVIVVAVPAAIMVGLANRFLDFVEPIEARLANPMRVLGGPPG